MSVDIDIGSDGSHDFIDDEVERIRAETADGSRLTAFATEYIESEHGLGLGVEREKVRTLWQHLVAAYQRMITTIDNALPHAQDVMTPVLRTSNEGMLTAYKTFNRHLVDVDCPDDIIAYGLEQSKYHGSF